MAATPGLNYFGLLSHGFGTPTIHAALNTVQNYLRELLVVTGNGGAAPASGTACCASDSGVSIDDDMASESSNRKPLNTKRR